MMATDDFLATLVSVALVITTAAPILLLGMLIRDWLKGKLW